MSYLSAFKNVQYTFSGSMLNRKIFNNIGFLKLSWSVGVTTIFVSV